MNINVSHLGHTFYPAWISLEAFLTGGSSKTEISALHHTVCLIPVFFLFLMCAFTYLSKFILTLGLSIIWGIRVTNVPQPDFYIQMLLMSIMFISSLFPAWNHVSKNTAPKAKTLTCLRASYIFGVFSLSQSHYRMLRSQMCEG